jgi:hypothetical protein
MRRNVLLGSVLLPVALIAAGCSQVAHADTPAGPVISSAPIASPAPTSAAPTPTPNETSVAPTKTATVRPRPAKTATSRPKVLGPTGLGALKLGMSSDQATATGLISGWTGTEGPDCGHVAHLQAAHGKKAGADGTVMAGSEIGVEIIDAYPGISTPEGIHIGSSEAALYKAYPSWKNVEDPDPKRDGRGLVSVPGNSAAYYRIVKIDSKVIQLTLQFKNQGCYE